jgi:hypothetical protein
VTKLARICGLKARIGKDYRSRGGNNLTTQQAAPGIFATTS